MTQHPRNKAARTYETIKYRCLGCKQFTTFGGNGLCAKCLDDCGVGDHNGG